MAEDLTIIKGDKTEQYKSLIPQIEALLEGEPDLIANLANTVAALKEQFGWLWVGFYLVKNNELVLAPFQGPIACTRIRKGKGVCGTSWAQAKTLIVPDVEKFPGHIACSSLSRSACNSSNFSDFKSLILSRRSSFFVLRSSRSSFTSAGVSFFLTSACCCEENNVGQDHSFAGDNCGALCGSDGCHRAVMHPLQCASPTSLQTGLLR